MRDMTYNPSGNGIQFVYMRRSGSHAIMEWMIHNRFGYPSALVNNLARDSDPWHANTMWLYHGYGNAQRLGSASDIPADANILESYEDVGSETSRQLPDGAQRILIIRDPYNMAASRLQRGWNMRLDTWKLHAREALGYSRTFGLAETIKYNDWLAHRYKRVPGTARGSSFDGTSLDGHGDRMNVTQRWVEYRDHPQMKKLMRDPDVTWLSAQLFGTVLEE